MNRERRRVQKVFREIWQRLLIEEEQRTKEVHQRETELERLQLELMHLQSRLMKERKRIRDMLLFKDSQIQSLLEEREHLVNENKNLHVSYLALKSCSEKSSPSSSFSTGSRYMLYSPTETFREEEMPPELGFIPSENYSLHANEIAKAESDDKVKEYIRNTEVSIREANQSRENLNKDSNNTVDKIVKVKPPVASRASVDQKLRNGKIHFPMKHPNISFPNRFTSVPNKSSDFGPDTPVEPENRDRESLVGDNVGKCKSEDREIISENEMNATETMSPLRRCNTLPEVKLVTFWSEQFL